ncbi:MAG: hypothetical protein QOJ54_3434 [Aliidongia sp.]|nr:hypothetical protein [Aliidongia sp.]
MDAGTEPDMATGPALNVVGIGIFPFPGVTVRRGEDSPSPIATSPRRTGLVVVRKIVCTGDSKRMASSTAARAKDGLARWRDPIDPETEPDNKNATPIPATVVSRPARSTAADFFRQNLAGIGKHGERKTLGQFRNRIERDPDSDENGSIDDTGTIVAISERPCPAGNSPILTRPRVSRPAADRECRR